MPNFFPASGGESLDYNLGGSGSRLFNLGASKQGFSRASSFFNFVDNVVGAFFDGFTNQPENDKSIILMSKQKITL